MSLLLGGRGTRPGATGAAAAAAAAAARVALVAVLGALVLLTLVAVRVGAAGPPFPPPVEGRRVYDTAEVFSPAAVAQAETVIARIESQTGAQVVVYTQTKPEATEESVKADGAALGNQWGVGRKGFDDGLVLIFDMADNGRNGKVAFVGGTGFRAVYLDDGATAAILEETMLPLLRAGNLDGALEAGLERVARATTPEEARKLLIARQVNALIGLVVGPLLLALLAGYAFLRWFREGRDPEFLDSPSIFLPAPPDGLTAATGALVLDGRSSRRALTAALLDLASRDEIAFVKKVLALRRDTLGIEIREPALADPRIRLNRRTPTGKGEEKALQQLRLKAEWKDGSQVVEGDDLLAFGTTVASFEQALEQGAVDAGLFTGRPQSVVGLWVGVAVAEGIGAIIALTLGLSLPASGIALLAAWLAIAALLTGLLARHMPARTRQGAMIRAMLLAYRRTLAATLAQARSIDQVVADPRLAWLETPDRAVVWATALGLADEVQEVLDRTVDDLRDGRATPGALYSPNWFYVHGTGGGGGLAPGLMSGSAMPDLGGMFAALGTIGNQPSSSGSGSGGGMGGGGGFSGGSSGSF